MCLRAEQGIVIADKTVLKMMHEMGVSCGIRRETDYHRYNSYKGRVGKTFENVIGRDFEAAGPRKKMGTDITGFKQPWGKAYFAPIYDFGSKEIVAWATSLHPDMAQQHELLDEFISRKPEGASPILHSDRVAARLAAAREDHARGRDRAVDGLDIVALGQRGDGVAHGRHQGRVRARAHLREPRAGGARDLRVHRALLQQGEDPLGAGIPQPRGVRAGQPARGRSPPEGGVGV